MDSNNLIKLKNKLFLGLNGGLVVKRGSEEGVSNNTLNPDPIKKSRAHKEVESPSHAPIKCL